MSPIVKVMLPADRTASVASALSSALIPATVEVPQTWQLLTGHGNGVMQVWGVLGGLLTPLLRIGGQASPVTAVTVCSALGLLCSAHSDGKLQLHGVPNPRGHSALSVVPADRSISAVKLSTCELRAAE